MNILLKSMESVSSNCRTLDSSTSPTETSYQYLLLKVRDELRLKCSRKRSSDDFHYWFIFFFFFLSLLLSRCVAYINVTSQVSLMCT